MSDRLPPVVRSDVDPGTEHHFDAFSDAVDRMFGDSSDPPFIIKRPSDGALLGPFPFLFAQPEAGAAYMELMKKLAAIPNLPPDAKEVVILAVGAVYKAAYELYAHVNVAIKQAGLPKDAAEAIASGKKPDGLNEKCSVAYDVATYLVGTPGPLPRELWDKSMKTFGKEATIGIIHYAGAYAYTCIALNAMDAPIPKDGD